VPIRLTRMDFSHVERIEGKHQQQEMEFAKQKTSTRALRVFLHAPCMHGQASVNKTFQIAKARPSHKTSSLKKSTSKAIRRPHSQTFKVAATTKSTRHETTRHQTDGPGVAAMGQMSAIHALRQIISAAHVITESGVLEVAPSCTHVMNANKTIDVTPGASCG